MMLSQNLSLSLISFILILNYVRCFRSVLHSDFMKPHKNLLEPTGRFSYVGGNLCRNTPKSEVKMSEKGTDKHDLHEPEVETLESKTRRAVVGILFAFATASWAKIQFDPQLNKAESALKEVSPQAARIFSRVVWGDKAVPNQANRVSRQNLRGDFARSLGDCILDAAVSDLHLVDKSLILRDEKAIATKAVKLFPDAAKLSSDFDGNFDTSWGSEELANVALYSRLRTLSPYLPSPLSRKKFREAVANRFLQADLLPGFDLQKYTVREPRNETDTWLGGIAAMLRAYEECGYGLCDIGDKGIGTLDREGWAEDGRGALTISVRRVALMTACQTLASESLNDLSAALLPTAVLTAYLRRCGLACDAEDYYISETYTRDPSQYRPDGIVIQLNLSVDPVSS